MNKIPSITIARIGAHRTVKFAADELRRYLKLMDSNIIVDVRLYEEYDASQSDLLWVGMSEKFAEKLPIVEDVTLDDAISLDVHDFCGVITGNNNRSVLIAVYRFLRELGIAFVHQGEAGEIIPKRILDTCEIHITETASCRYRVVCIEGAVNYEHIYNMIDWIPKAGMNGYLMQFFTPMVFLNRWHEHSYNASLGVDPVSREEAYSILKKCEEDIAERSLIYQAVGHGWTSEAFGVPSNGWAPVDPETVPEEALELFAEINGKRGLFKNVPASTQLCYSDPRAVEIMSRTIADYCKAHPEVDQIIASLADGSNNHCECERCRKLRPSDWYVGILNRLDELLTEYGLNTKVLLAAYNENMWAPLETKFNNPGRFILQYCPITRPYNEAYDELDLDDLGEEPPFELNKMVRPRKMRPLMKLYRKWQEKNPGLGFCLFDYHLWFSTIGCDPGRFAISKIILRDMKALPGLDINGNLSCQVQREGFPTNLPMQAMAQSLWDSSVDFDDVANEQLAYEFGDQYKIAREYLEGLSDMIAYWPDRLAEPEIIVDDEKRKNAERAIEHVAKYKPIIEKIAEGEFEYELQKRSWNNLLTHTEVGDICARLAALKFAGKTPDERKDVQLEYHNFFRRTEPELHRITDLARQLMNTGAGAE
ncbi:MAG: DUF4838 domain-containing protein [Clostridia bacterium]|nr:DUF4838 domain-containing protein [Clostridia bacterium]